MSYEHPVNKPNGSNEQYFYCFKPWEAKHITGKDEKKINEFRATPGIKSISYTKRAHLSG
jgi:hypothetical protein